MMLSSVAVSETVGPVPSDRRLAGVPAVPVRLADGQTWYLAAAEVRFKPEFSGDRMIGVSTYRGFPTRCEPMVQAMTVELESGDLRVETLVGVAVSLLRAAHNLSAEETGRLMTLGESSVPELLEAVLRAVRGQVPADDPLAGSLDDRSAA